MAGGALVAGLKDFVLAVLRFVLLPIIIPVKHWDQTKQFLIFLIRALIFPLLWVWSLGIARKHSDTDPAAVKKVGAAIVAGLVLAGGVTYLLYDFQEDARHEMYVKLDTRLAGTTGESAYQAALEGISIADGQLEILRMNLERAEANGETENATAFQQTIDEVEAQRADFVAESIDLRPNHDFYLDLKPVVMAQDDARALSMLHDAGLDRDFDLERSEHWFRVNDKAETDMMQVMIYLLYPGVFGVLVAPLFFALGNILKSAFEPSESVGFKVYPGASMGWFLLFGAFGLPSVLFAAWGAWDMQVRSVEGQISL